MSMLKLERSAGTLGTCLLVAACLLAGACESVPVLDSIGRPNGGQGSPQLPPQQVQVELMAFTDSYTALLGQTCDRYARAFPEQRHRMLQTKIESINNAIIIAAGPNPVGALLDMTVMVTLQRQLAEEYWVPEVFGDPGEPLIEALRILEREIWTLASRALAEDAVKALEALIPEIRARFPDQVSVSAIRASDFAEDRRAAVVRLEGGSSLLQLFQLDPLAGLNPASQELAQSRLLAERFFFWVKRMPILLNWQMEDLVLDTLSEPDVQSLIDASTRLGEASRSFSDTAAELSEWLPEERAAAIDQAARQLSVEIDAAITQASDRLAIERDAAISQTLDGIAAEREAILQTFENEEVRLRGLLEDLRHTVEVTTLLSSSLNETVVSTDRFFSSFRRDPTQPPPRDRRPFDIADYRATAETTTETIRELNDLVGSLEELLASPDWEERSALISTAAAEGRASVEQLIDRLFLRALVVVLAFVAASLAAMVVYRMLFRRGASPAPGS